MKIGNLGKIHRMDRCPSSSRFKREVYLGIFDRVQYQRRYATVIKMQYLCQKETHQWDSFVTER